MSYWIKTYRPSITIIMSTHTSVSLICKRNSTDIFFRPSSFPKITVWIRCLHPSATETALLILGLQLYQSTNFGNTLSINLTQRDSVEDNDILYITIIHTTMYLSVDCMKRLSVSLMNKTVDTSCFPCSGHSLRTTWCFSCVVFMVTNEGVL